MPDLSPEVRALLTGWGDQGPAGVLKRATPRTFEPHTGGQTVTLAVNPADVERVGRSLYGRWDLPTVRVVALPAVPAGQMWAWMGTLSDTNRPAVYGLPEEGTALL
jgi:hypothetical protein